MPFSFRKEFSDGTDALRWPWSDVRDVARVKTAGVSTGGGTAAAGFAAAAAAQAPTTAAATADRAERCAATAGAKPLAAVIGWVFDKPGAGSSSADEKEDGERAEDEPEGFHGHTYKVN